jgi:capsular polysaccharide biosynthesis protein
MPSVADSETFHSGEYIDYLRARWRVVAVAVTAAAVVAVIACLLLPKQYTAKATLVIDPPGSDGRPATSVSPVYLESLKSYEAFASSDSLFAKACEKFHLLDGPGAPALESFKRKVLRVDKLKDERVLEMSVTLPNPAQAQALVQYLAEQAVILSHELGHAGDKEPLDQVQGPFDAATAELEKARAESAAVTAAGSEPVLEGEAQGLADLRARTEAQRIDANLTLADSTARGDQEGAAAARARAAALTADVASLQKQVDEKASALAALRSRRMHADDRLRSAENAFDNARRRVEDVINASRFRNEQLRVVDPGIVPQKPSFPNLALTLVAAVVLSLVACLLWLTLQFGLAGQRERALRPGLRIAGGGGR